MNKLALVKQNYLLASLPEDELKRWLPQLEAVDMPLGEVVYESGDEMTHVYFPTTAVVSILFVMKGGNSAEIAVVGNDGLVGISLFMGGASTSSMGLVQNAGAGYRMKAELVKAAFEKSTTVMRLFLRYTQVLITQMTTSAACNKHHSLDQQMCRWILLTLDRKEGNEISMTKQLIVNMLGTDGDQLRDGARILEKEGFIRYAKGTITVIDREALEKRSCECYRVVEDEYERLLPGRILRHAATASAAH